MPSLTSLGTVFSENFNGLVSTGTSSTLPAGWAIAESGTNANGIYTAGTGSGNAGDTYSFGAAASSERALGGLQSGSLIPSFGASFTNDTGEAISALQIAYTGEQWRLGATGRVDRLDFQISFDATSLTTGTWIDVNGLDFGSLVTTGALGALDGNANSALVSATYNVAGGIASGASFWIRWTDFNASGADDGLAIDDFAITALAAPAGPGSFGVTASSAAEDAASGFVEFLVTRSDGSSGAATVSYEVTAGTASGADFAGGVLPSGTVAFADGQTSATIQIAIADDADVESDETFTLTLTGTTAGSIGAASATGTILNDDFPPTPLANVFINEIHYDNAGTDADERIEVAGVAGTDLTGWTLALYNGNGGGTYGTVALSGVIADQDDGYGTLSFAAAGLQNGSPDGIALVDNLGRVVQFLSYEGTIVATAGPAQGMTSTDIGVVQESAPVGTSLSLVGTGSSYEDFAWAAQADDSFGAANAGQDFLSPTAPGQFRILDASVVEGDAGTVDLVFTVRRAGGAGETATVDYAVTLDGTANAGDLGAGAVFTGTLTFDPGVSVRQVVVPIQGDTTGELNETLSVTLSNAVNATIVDGAATGTIVNDDPQALAIYQIQGERHASEYAGQIVTTTGIVTAVAGNGFYLQDAAGDGNARTSDGIFVFTGTAPGVNIGYSVSVTGTVQEFLPGGAATNLTITQITASAVAIAKDASDAPIVSALPAAVVIGATGGVLPPSDVFDNDQFTVYDPENDAADFYESLEGMRATVAAPTVVDRTNQFGETWVLASGGTGASGLNGRGGITISGNADGFDDYNPERIQLDDDTALFAGFNPSYTQGDRLSDVTGVFSYNFQSYELLVTEAVTVTENKPEPAREITALVGDADHLTMASYNVENLDPDDGKFDILASDIVYQLRAPDVIALQEIQDADGAGSGSDLSGYVTAQGLIDAIAAIGGPDYVYIEITPTTAGSTGGEPGGNIRNGFLYNASRVDYVDGSAELVPGGAFAGSRTPLAATFSFNGEDVTAISVHSTSRGGSDPLFGATQPPANGGEAARLAQSEAIRDYVVDLLGADAEARIAVLGDFNAFYFEDSLELLEEGGVLTNLHRTIPEEERYSYMFGGNAQALDNFLVTGSLLAGAQFDPVHINAEQADTAARGTDHDPLVASFLIPAPEVPGTLEIDLSNYVRIGRYDLPEPTRTSAPANSVLAQEVSAVTWNRDTDTLFVVGDGGTSIVQISKTGQLIDSMTLATGSSPQGTEFYDPEGLAYIGNGQFVMVEERDRNAVLFTYAAGTTLTRAAAQTVNLGSNVGNVGLEGLTYDPLSDSYIFVKEKDPEAVIKTEIDFAANTSASSDLFDPTGLNLIDLADVYALSNLSTIATSHEGNLLLLSQESARILEVDRQGNVLSVLSIVSDPGNPLDVVSQQHEGVAMDKDGYLYVVSENGGGDFDHPQLWVYAPSSVPNQAPTGIALTNALASIVENTGTAARVKVADVSVTDDGLGTNDLSVSGADAAFFEVDSTGLYIKAGTTIDFEAKSSYSVTVSVDDPGRGSAPDASTDYTLAVTDLANESTLPNLYISEVAPWSSGNGPVGADWFELTNGGSTTIDLTGWKMDDGSSSFASAVAMSGVASLAPGESAIFLEAAAPGTTAITAFINTWFGGSAPAGLKIGTYSGGGVGLSTGGDGVNVFNAAGALQASVSFGASPNGPFPTFDNAAGLNNATITTTSQIGLNGAFQAPGDATETGSPGSVGRLIVSEVAPWSSGDSPVGADWFEVTNTSAFAIDLTGWKVDDASGSPAAAVALNGVTSIAAGESVIFIESADPVAARQKFIDTWFGGNAPAGLQIGTYTGGGIGLSTGGDAVHLYDASNKLQASVSFGASPAGPFATFDNAAGRNGTAIATLSAIGVNAAFTAVNDSDAIGSPGEIVPLNDAPIAADDALSSVTDISGARTIAFASLLANDLAGPAGEAAQTLAITAVGDAVGGTVAIVGTDVVFTPTAGFLGEASFDYTVRDNGKTRGLDDFRTDVGTARFDIVSGNKAPTDLVIDDATIAENAGVGALVGTLGATDAAGDVLTYSLLDDAGGRFAVNAATGAVTATKSFDFESETSFAVVARVQDQGGLSVDRSFTIAVANVDEAPNAGNDVAAVQEDATTANLWSMLLANDSDPDDGATLGIVSVDTSATLGSVQFDAATQTLRYVADDDAFDDLATGAKATDTFKYTVTDAGGLASTATVTVTVTGIADGIVRIGTLGNDKLAGTAGEDLIGGLLGNDKLDGLDGHDKLWGGIGNDHLTGGTGNDMLSGDLGNDQLKGGDGDDSLFGDLGNDTLTGGAGRDVFGFGLLGGNDTVTDFSIAEDTLMLGFGVSVTKTKVSDVNADGIADLTLTFGLHSGSATLLGVNSYAAVHVEQGNLFVSQSPF